MLLKLAQQIHAQGDEEECTGGTKCESTTQAAYIVIRRTRITEWVQSEMITDCLALIRCKEKKEKHS
jgi:hypothetical protein